MRNARPSIWKYRSPVHMKIPAPRVSTLGIPSERYRRASFTLHPMSSEALRRVSLLMRAERKDIPEKYPRVNLREYFPNYSSGLFGHGRSLRGPFNLNPPNALILRSLKRLSHAL